MKLDKWLLISDENDSKGNSGWRFRRKLIFAGFRLGVLMVLFGMATFFWDREVTAQLVIGGVSLISIILSAYVAAATFDDKFGSNKKANEDEPIQ